MDSTSNNDVADNKIVDRSVVKLYPGSSITIAQAINDLATLSGNVPFELFTNEELELLVRLNGEIMNRFEQISDGFNYGNSEHKKLRLELDAMCHLAHAQYYLVICNAYLLENTMPPIFNAEELYKCAESFFDIMNNLKHVERYRSTFKGIRLFEDYKRIAKTFFENKNRYKNARRNLLKVNLEA